MERSAMERSAMELSAITVSDRTASDGTAFVFAVSYNKSNLGIVPPAVCVRFFETNEKRNKKGN